LAAAACVARQLSGKGAAGWSWPEHAAMPASSVHPITASTLRFRLRPWLLVVVKFTRFLHSQGAQRPLPLKNFCIRHAAAQLVGRCAVAVLRH
jgi:hypothetical protein